MSDEVMRLVETLDGLVRYRFDGNAELRAAWESARNVVSGPRGKEEPVAEPPAAAPGDGGEAGGVRGGDGGALRGGGGGFRPLV